MTQVDRLLLPRGVTAGQLIAQLAELDPDDRLVCGDDGITLSWLRVASVDEAAPDPVADALRVPHLPAIARKLRDLPAAPGRPRVQDAAIALRLDVRRPAAERIAGALAGLPWPPDWLPEPAAGGGR